VLKKFQRVKSSGSRKPPAQLGQQLNSKKLVRIRATP